MFAAPFRSRFWQSRGHDARSSRVARASVGPDDDLDILA
jgi:hypothetical protein